MSPSLKSQVIEQIFFAAITMNEIFSDKTETIDKIINFVKPRLHMPEDFVVEYGMNDKGIYFIAHGKCLISIPNHLRAKNSVGEIDKGDYFGEISVLFGSNRTANIQCITHCTLGYLSY